MILLTSGQIQLQSVLDKKYYPAWLFLQLLYGKGIIVSLVQMQHGNNWLDCSTAGEGLRGFGGLQSQYESTKCFSDGVKNKANSKLGWINRNVVCKLLGVILSLYSALIKSHLESCV